MNGHVSVQVNVDGAGFVCDTFKSFDGGASWDDSGQSFDSPILVADTAMWGVTAIGPDGEVYVAGRRSTDLSRFVFARSSAASSAMASSPATPARGHQDPHLTLTLTLSPKGRGNQRTP